MWMDWMDGNLCVVKYRAAYAANNDNDIYKVQLITKGKVYSEKLTYSDYILFHQKNKVLSSDGRVESF